MAMPSVSRTFRVRLPKLNLTLEELDPDDEDDTEDTDDDLPTVAELLTGEAKAAIDGLLDAAEQCSPQQAALAMRLRQGAKTIKTLISNRTVAKPGLSGHVERFGEALGVLEVAVRSLNTVAEEAGAEIMVLERAIGEFKEIYTGMEVFL